MPIDLGKTIERVMRMSAADHAEHPDAHPVDSGVTCVGIRRFDIHKWGIETVLATVQMEGRDKPMDVQYVVSNPYVSVLPWGWKEGTMYVLLARSVKPAAGRMWDAYEGGIAGGRDEAQAAKKEVLDEAGLNVSYSSLMALGMYFQQSDKGLEGRPFDGGHPEPKRSRAFLAQIPSELVSSNTEDEQRLDAEEIIRPVWMPLDEAIDTVEHAALGQNEEGDLGASPVLLMMLYRLWRMNKLGQCNE